MLGVHSYILTLPSLLTPNVHVRTSTSTYYPNMALNLLLLAIELPGLMGRQMSCIYMYI